MASAEATVKRALKAATARLPELFAPGTRLVVGFSGGQDSSCLLHALSRSRTPLELVAAHVDHALRPDSAETAARVKQAAAAMGVGCEVRRVDVGSLVLPALQRHCGQGGLATERRPPEAGGLVFIASNNPPIRS